jgi:small-conductance mechanosensitive channel
LEELKDPALRARLTWQGDLEQVRSHLAAASLASFETKRQIANGEVLESRQRLAFAQRQLALAGAQVRFSQADLDKVMENLGSQQRRLEREVQDAEATLDTREKALAGARENLRRALQESSGTSSNASQLRRLQEVVDVREVERQTSLQTLMAYRQMLEGLGHQRETWRARFAASGSDDFGELQAANRRLRWLGGLLRAARPYYSRQLDLAGSQVVEQEQRLVRQGGGEADPVLAGELLRTYQERQALYLRALQSLEQGERAILRWQEALEFDRRALPFAGRVRDLFTETSSFFAKLWNLEVFVAQDTITVDGQPITGRRAVTVGKLVAAVLILAVGYWISGWIARLLERLARERLKVETNQANLIRRWVRVVLVLGLLVFSLVSVKIPLTIFAFAGGALAIGVGFGTQNLLKNFISGIVILFERPFRVGDVLQVEGHSGVVTSIGIRSSVIQLWNGTETLIPNSTLLENNLTNWTYSNRTARFTINVGVAYGSDTRRVAQILADVADRHGLVEKDPKPQVLFTEFGDNALLFELRYWVHILNHNAAQIASDLRHMIGGAFAEQGIVMAFPQRDVHLRMEEPFSVQVVSQRGDPQSQTPAAKPVGSTSDGDNGGQMPNETGLKRPPEPQP